MRTNSNPKKSTKMDSLFSTAESCKGAVCKKLPVQSISRLRGTKAFQFTNQLSQIVSPLKKLQVNEFIEKTLFLVNYYHKKSKLGFHMSAVKFLSKDWVEYRAKLNERLNKIIYMEPTLKFKKFEEIEQQIMKEWKKNHILYALQTLWFNAILKHNFANPEEFQQQYQTQKHFTAQLSYLISRPYFEVLESKGFPALDRLTEETSNFIITNYEDWQKVHMNVIYKLFRDNNTQPQINYEFDLLSLELEQHIVDFNNDLIFPRTIDNIKKFAEEVRLSDKIKALENIRSSLENQIKIQQTKLIESGKMEKYKVIQKDDFIGSLICCLVKGQVKNLHIAFRTFHTLLGAEIGSILSRCGVDSYRADLESAYQFLAENSLTSVLVNVPPLNSRSLEAASPEIAFAQKDVKSEP